MDSVEIRRRFINYFEEMGYQSLPRAPMIDPSIPMSFVMSAGLVQVENSLARATKRDGNQYVLVQECFRHFDLEKVGTDDIHLSLFEMPGAFVFGPNGKAGTVRKMWSLATSVLGIEKEHIWASYFRGGNVVNEFLPEDTITRDAWLKIGLPENHLVGLGPDNNYWMQGKGIDNADAPKKCGPNTELFFDRGIEKACGQDCKPGCKCGRFVEFSNSLFISSEVSQNGKSLQPLGNPFTETVIGTERVNMIRQKATSVFDTSEFAPLIDAIRKLEYVDALNEDLIVASERVIADHIRGLFYLIANGAPPPGKNGRERIIKMLVRRTITRLLVLNIDVKQFLNEITLRLLDTFPGVQAENAGQLFTTYFISEFQRFERTINRGKRQLAYFLEENGGQRLTDDQIVELEKKRGLPSLLTAKYLKLNLSYIESEYESPLMLSKWQGGNYGKTA